MDTMMAINQQIRTPSPDSVQPEICNQLKLHESEPVETQEKWIITTKQH